MAIQFQFTLNDGEAENLFHYINREISDCHKSIRKEMIGANRQEYISWYENHIEYIKKMQETMLKNQKRVEDSKEFDL
jgi:penicillin-binding protein-related factor A (putative recombinase)